MSSIYLFYGEDSFSAKEKAGFWVSEFEIKFGEVNVVRLSGSGMAVADLRDAVLTQSFLAEKRMVVVEDFLALGKDAEQKKVAEFLGAGVPDGVVVLMVETIKKPDARTVLWKKLKKVAKLEEFKRRKGMALGKWIGERVERAGGRIEAGAVDLLMSYCADGDLWRISNELKKLLLYAGDEAISEKMVRRLVVVDLEVTVFELTDAVGAGRIEVALKKLEVMRDKREELMVVLFMLVRHFRIMVQVKELVERGERVGAVAKIVREHPFVVEKIAEQSRNFDWRLLKEMYGLWAGIDAGLKSGRIVLGSDDQGELLRAMEVGLVKLLNSKNAILGR